MKTQKKTYGEAQKKHAVNLRKISRFTYAEIEAETGIPQGYLRKLIHEENAKEVTLSGTGNGTEVTEMETFVTDAVTPEKQAENVENAGKSAVADVIKKIDFELIDLVYYSTLFTSVYGFATLLGWYAAFISIPYLCIGFHAFEMAKDPAVTKTAERGRSAIIVSELIAMFSHSYLFFKALWARKEALPFRVFETIRKGAEWDIKAGQYGGEWVNMEWVIAISIACAIAIFAAVWYVVDTRLELTKERKQNKN